MDIGKMINHALNFALCSFSRNTSQGCSENIVLNQVTYNMCGCVVVHWSPLVCVHVYMTMFKSQLLIQTICYLYMINPYFKLKAQIFYSIINRLKINLIWISQTFEGDSIWTYLLGPQLCIFKISFFQL